MKLLIGVPGSLHAFDLARRLAQRGHDVTLATSYPRWKAQRLEAGQARVVCFGRFWLLQAVASRLRMPRFFWERSFALGFSRSLAALIRREVYQSALLFSGVAREALPAAREAGTRVLLIRGSTHIREQARILEEHSRRLGIALPGPTPWMIAREEFEYANASCVVVLSQFCYESFIKQGHPADRLLRRMPTTHAHYHKLEPSERSPVGAPLRVLFVGYFSGRKGAFEFCAAARRCHNKCEFHVVGRVGAEVEPWLKQAGDAVTLHGYLSGDQLVEMYRSSDALLLPSYEEGLAAVLLQAMLAGLPIVATPNSGAGDLLELGAAVTLVPPADVEAVVKALEALPVPRKPPPVAAYEAACEDGLRRLCERLS